MKIALGIEYNGKNYHGWQNQKEVITIQETLEKAISYIANQKIKVICAGRTDTGVHSSGQIIHFQTTSKRTEKAWTIGVNSKLPNDISVCWIKKVPNNFHARYSATSRQYQYIINNSILRSALLNDYSYHFFKPLNEKKMHYSGQYLIGEHDFTSFRSTYCQSKSPYRKIMNLSVSRFKNLIIINIQANSFLQHMVRNIVGSLIEVGTNKKPENWIQKVLKKKNRRLAGITAKSSGLNLIYVNYPIKFNFIKNKKPQFVL
ncbi:tRNA pseudouridine synthase A [Buchnera aphidicola (Anoecia corni)]|uniref:tRNA pseudouridine synthase A n=1 Tax=Buchnera aphidicola (Anoecia corni) TaxID=2994477 RepID=A0AAT9IFX2_9GAMM